MSTAQPLANPTYADLEAVPENMRGEIIGGELLMSPRPAPKHAVAAGGLLSLVMGPFQYGIGGPGGWWILTEPEVRLRGECFIPDIAGWRLETMPELPDAATLTIAPDWVCEVLSPSTERLDRGKKLAAYSRHRVSHVWLVNPTSRTIEVLRRTGDTWTLVHVHDEDVPLAAEPFEAVPLPVQLIWQSPARVPAGPGVQEGE